MKTKFLGSETFGTGTIKTDEYLLLAKACVENGSTLEEAQRDISFIDDCLSMRKMMVTFGKRKDAVYTESGRMRKKSNYTDFVNNRLDLLLKEERQSKQQ